MMDLTFFIFKDRAFELREKLIEEFNGKKFDLTDKEQIGYYKVMNVLNDLIIDGLNKEQAHIPMFTDEYYTLTRPGVMFDSLYFLIDMAQLIHQKNNLVTFINENRGLLSGEEESAYSEIYSKIQLMISKMDEERRVYESRRAI